MAKKTGYYDYLRQELGGLIEQLQIPDLYKKSLKRRWLDQIIWAEKKASECRRWHYRLRITTIVGSVILPALVGLNFQLGKDNPFFRTWFPYVPFALSQLIAVSAAIEEFCRFGDRWRDYRKMAEDLKTEGWQYLQLSGPYQYGGAETEEEVQEAVRSTVVLKAFLSQKSKETEDLPKTHLDSYSLFAGRVENIIKNDVQGYIQELINQKTKQDQKIEKYLKSAQDVIADETLFNRVEPSRGSWQSAAPEASNGLPPADAVPVFRPPSVTNNRNGNGMMPVSTLSAGSNSTLLPSSVAPPIAPSPPVVPPAPTPIATITPLPVVPPPQPSSSSMPVADLNAEIVAAANRLRNISTAEGPDGGNNACAWTVNKVLKEAGITPPLGENPNYVPSLLEALKRGRGQQVSKAEAKAGDLVIAYEEAHIGIGLDDGCNRVLSNSSSRARFCWESDIDFDWAYQGESTIYRLIG